LTVTPFGDRYLTALDRGHPADDNHDVSDSVVVLREKLMHDLPVRVVAATNVDRKIMSRRTPTDSVWAEEVCDGSGCESCDHRRSGNLEKASISLSR
jgi:hypothetical protein